MAAARARMPGDAPALRLLLVGTALRSSHRHHAGPSPQGACRGIRQPVQLVAGAQLGREFRAPAVRTLPRCCRPVVPRALARRETRSSATESAPACRADTRRTVVPSLVPALLRGFDTRAPARATEPTAVSRPHAALRTGALAATGRRRWRLPAGFSSPHGRTGGVVAWRESTGGAELRGVWKTQHLMARSVTPRSWGLCSSQHFLHST